MGDNLSVKLKSDWCDYYDHMFDSSGVVFERMSRGGMNKKEQFKFLQSFGLKVPEYGTPVSFYRQAKKDWKEWTDRAANDIIELIVYTDTSAHCGEGKIKVSLAEAIEKYPKHFCSLYYATKMQGGMTYRYLQIGDRRFWLSYTSNDDWRSNCGEVSVSVMCEEQSGFGKIPQALYAIDLLVFSQNLIAVDYNIAPGLKSTGLEERIKPIEVVEAIKRGISYFNKPVVV